MNKTQLVKWLEQKQTESIDEVERQFSETLNNYITSRNTKVKLDELSSKLTSLFKKADGLLDEWLEQLSKVEGLDINNGYYNSMRRKMDGFTTQSNVTKWLEQEFSDNSDILKSMKKTRNDTISEIKRNYVNVIENVKGMKNAKVAVEYLEGLGFDLSHLKEADEHPTTALVAQVDTRFLFIGGKNNAD